MGEVIVEEPESSSTGTMMVAVLPQPVHRRGDSEILAACRAVGQTIAQAATAAGISERQARRRLQEPAVAARVVELRTDYQAENLAALERLGLKAVTRLSDLLDSPNASVALGAVRVVLGLGADLRERVETETRVRRIEKLAAERERQWRATPTQGWPS